MNDKIENTQKFNTFFIVSIGLVIATGRIIFPESDQNTILILMAVVNVAALGIVLLFIFNGIYSKTFYKIESSGIYTTSKKRLRTMLFSFFSLLIFFYTLWGIFYVMKLKTAKWNDALSIVALAFSIATDGLVEYEAVAIYKILNKINRRFFKRK